MTFLSKWFKQAAEIGRLRSELDFASRKTTEIESLLDREEQRTKLLEKAVEKARNSEILTLRRVADAKFKQQGLPQKFVDDVTEKAEAVPEVDEAEEARILELATEMQTNDNLDPELAENPYPIDWYIAEVKKDGIDSIIIG